MLNFLICERTKKTIRKMQFLGFCLLFSALINTAVLAQLREGYLDILPRTKVVTKAVGENLALTCKPIVRDPRLITQLEWLDPKNRRIGSSRENNNNIYVQTFPGESGSMLIFPKITENADGVYTCTAMYANSQELKANVTVETYEEITFVDAPANQYPINGKDYTIKCKVQGNPPPTVDWYKQDQNIVTQDRYITVDGGLIIKNVRPSDDGVYKCTAVVSSTGQYKSQEIRLEVLIPPTIKEMKPISVVEGESAYIQCKGEGKPPPSYSWIKESTSEDLSKTNRFTVREISGDLTINRVEFNDDSFYKCVAKNQAGTMESRVKINVLVKPNIYELLNTTSPIHNESKLICKAHGRPPPQITFHKLSNKLPFGFGQQKDDGRIILEQQTVNDKGESIGTLIISNLNRSDDGLYRCKAENTAGEAYKMGHITVEFPPTFERTINFTRFWSWGNRPGNLSCIPEAIPNATIKWMHQGREIMGDTVNFKIMGTSPRSNLIVYPYNQRQFFTQYECVATNKLGRKAISLELREAFRPDMIQQIKPNSITATTIKFTVVPPSFFDDLPIRTITVQYKPERELTWDYAVNHTWSFGSPYILEDLLPERTYQFRFAARNDVGMGIWTNAETISMPRRSEPAEPKMLLPPTSIIDSNVSNRADMVALSHFPDHFELRWNVPNDNGDPIIGYEIRYCKTEKIAGEWRDSECSEIIEQTVKQTSYDLRPLRPDTTYKIELRARNAIGASSPAQIRVKTARGLNPMVSADTATISSGAIIGIVVVSILLLLLVVDIACFLVNRNGILATVCHKSKYEEKEDPKLGREETEPLNGNGPLVNMEKSISVEFDGKQVHSRPGEIIGKHSAV